MSTTRSTSVAHLLAGLALVGSAVVLAPALAAAESPAGKAGSATGEAATAAVAGPRAQALVAADLTVKRLRGVVAVTRPSTGIYCVKLVSTLKAGGVVAAATPDYATSPHTAVAVQWDSTPDDCPGNSLEVRTFLDGGGSYTPSDEGFGIVVP